MKQHDELSAPAILGISIAIAIVGAIVYGLATPIAPAKLIALSHQAVDRTVTR
jgi:hypothetical protein